MGKTSSKYQQVKSLAMGTNQSHSCRKRPGNRAGKTNPERANKSNPSRSARIVGVHLSRFEKQHTGEWFKLASTVPGEQSLVSNVSSRRRHAPTNQANNRQLGFQVPPTCKSTPCGLTKKSPLNYKRILSGTFQSRWRVFFGITRRVACRR